MENRKYTLWDKDSVRDSLESFIKENGKFPIAIEMKSKNGLPCREIFEKVTGMNFYEYGKQYYPELIEKNWELHNKRVLEGKRVQLDWPMERLLEAVKKFVEQNGHMPTQEDYTIDKGLPNYKTYLIIAANYLNRHIMEQLDIKPKVNINKLKCNNIKPKVNIKKLERNNIKLQTDKLIAMFINMIVSDAMENISSFNDKLWFTTELNNYLISLDFENILLTKEGLSQLLEKHPAVDYVDEDTIYFKDIETLRTLGLNPNISTDTESYDMSELGDM